MNILLNKKHPSLPYRILSAFIAFTFTFSIITPPASGQMIPVLNLPPPGTMVTPTQGFVPVLVRGLTIHPENPLLFDFIVDTGHTDLDLNSEKFKKESQKLIKYFLASLTVPEDELWVNLSPYERNRIIPEGLGVTEMGRDMLAQDYMLKQLTASLMYPENEVGQKFWDRVYKKAYEMYGTTEIPMNTFNKIWIVPDKAGVYEKDNSVFVMERHLKVMMEEDYIALQKNLGTEEYGLDSVTKNEADIISGISSQIVREILIPEIEKEVNEGETFANLRQIYNSMILSKWYKETLQESLLGQVYMNRNKINGVDVQDKQIKEKIYNQYVESFKKGVYNYIREDYDSASQQIIPRKYFSGGLAAVKKVTRYPSPDGAEKVGNVASALVQLAEGPEGKILESYAVSQADKDLAITSSALEMVPLGDVDMSTLPKDKPILVGSNFDVIKDGKIKDPTKVIKGIEGLSRINHPMVFLTHNGRPQSYWAECLELYPLIHHIKHRNRTRLKYSHTQQSRNNYAS